MVIISVCFRRAAATVAATVGAGLLVGSVGSLDAQESRRESPDAATIPGRYSRQVAPTPSTYWRSPGLRDYVGVLKSTEAPLIDASKRYELPELIDLAQRVNPETRVAWERARQAALAVGLVESEYFPMLAVSALGGYRSVGVAIPKEIVSDGFFRFELAQAVPALNLRWLLLDFGRRTSARSMAVSTESCSADIGSNAEKSVSSIGVVGVMPMLSARVTWASRSLATTSSSSNMAWAPCWRASATSGRVASPRVSRLSAACCTARAASTALCATAMRARTLVRP